MRRRFYLCFIISLLMISNTPVDAQIDSNFTIKLLYLNDSNVLETIAQSLAYYWRQMYVDVEMKSVTKGIYESKLFYEENDWDIALFEYDSVNTNFPELAKYYTQNSFLGSIIYDFNASTLEYKETDSLVRFQQNLNDFTNANGESELTSKAANLQRIFNEELLIDLPIVNKPVIFISRLEFEGLDMDEDIIKSIFLGARWTSNPKNRQNNNPVDRLNIPAYDTLTMPNPLYFVTRSDKLIIDTLYSTPFMMDKTGKIHPNLAIDYTHSDNDTGSYWTINMNPNIYWSDGEKMDVDDIKFSIDLMTFPWIAANGMENWKNLEAVEILNDTSLLLSFDQYTINEPFMLSNLYILPEHVFNQTYVGGDGETYTPYVSGYPKDSNDWIDRFKTPVTAGPYKFSGSKEAEYITVVENKNYWFPSFENYKTLNGGSSNFGNKGYYFDYNISGQPVNELFIKEIFFQFSNNLIIDANSVQLLFNAGARDFIELETLEVSSKYYDDTEYVQNIIKNGNAGIKAIISPTSDVLKKYDMRRALALSIDRDTIKNVFGIGYVGMSTIVSKNFPNYYDGKYALEFNYNESRDIFLDNGYVVRRNLSQTSDTPLIVMNMAVFTIIFSYIKRKRLD